MKAWTGGVTNRHAYAHEDTSIQGSEDPLVGVNGWMDQDRHDASLNASGSRRWDGKS